MEIENNIIRKSYLWNLSASIMNAAQSVILLVVITHTLPIDVAGIFTIAYATANLLLIFANYGVRAFQVTDMDAQFTFGEYRASRIITVLGMYIIAFTFIFYMIISKNYSFEKGISVLFMCIWKSVDALEDVYYGMYQQQGRLDIGAKLLTIRIIFTVCIFTLSIVAIRNLNGALLITTMASGIFSVVSIVITKKKFTRINKRIYKKSIGKLLRLCFPVFAGGFLSFYISNAPKYAIEAQMNDAMQANYTFISMPVFVVGILNNCIYQPTLIKLAGIWKQGNKNEFVRAIVKQCSIVIVLTCSTMLIGYLFGIPILSFLYNTNLEAYRMELVILLAAGGGLAMSGFLCIVITIIRFQKSILYVYLVISLLAYRYFPIYVAKEQLKGAGTLYFILMCLLVAIFSFIILYRIKYRSFK